MLENNIEDINKNDNIKLYKNNHLKENEFADKNESKLADDSESLDKEKKIILPDYTKMTLEELNLELIKLLKNNPIQEIKLNIDNIKSVFNTKFSSLLAEKKETFLANGGNSIDFQFSYPVKTQYNKLIKEYKIKRDVYYKAQEKQLKENLEKRNLIIDELKQVIEKADSKTMYNDYKILNDRWKTIGLVPKNHYNNIWKTYQHHVERFYDILHLNNDFRSLDFKHNLEEKLKLISRAEKLSKLQDINLAFKDLQELHRIWKEDIGPVEKEHREEIWKKFSEATKKIHDRRHEYFREIRNKHEHIIEEKLAIIDKINTYDTTKNLTHKDWQKSVKEIEVLRQKYFEAGKLPYNKSEEVWQQFKSATKKFNTSKNKFYKEEKKEQNTNLNKKMKLVDLAESLKDSDNWNETTNTMKRIQAEWGKIGVVPRKYSDDIWKRFKEACNFYFNRLHNKIDEENQEQKSLIDNKKSFLISLKEKKSLSFDDINECISKWRDLGNLPRNDRHLENKFNKIIDFHLDKLNLNISDIEMFKFKNLISGYIAQKEFKKIDNEQFFLRKKIDETVRDMQQLENNLCFISNATKDNPFVINIHKQISQYKNQLDIWQFKLDYLKKIKY